MVFYEINLVVRPLTKPNLVQALKRACQGIWEQNGVVVKLENLGYKDLPFRLTKQKQAYTTGNQILIHCNMPRENTYKTLLSFKANDDIIHKYFRRVDPDAEEEWPPCTLHEELKPAAYRQNVAAARRYQSLSHEEKGAVSINGIDSKEELPPRTSTSSLSPKSSIFDRLRNFGRQYNVDPDAQRRTQELYRLFDSERIYCRNLKELISIIQKLKSLGLSISLLNVVEQCVRDLAVISENLYQSLEKIISKRSASDEGLGDLFNDNFWNEFNRYHFLYCSTIKPYLQEVRKSKRNLNEELISLENTIGQRLETLFLLPEERILAYRDHLRSIINFTPISDSDYENLKRKRDYVEKSLLESRCREISNVRNELKLEQVELNFHPLDNLQLKNSTSSGGVDFKMRQIAGRRKSTSAIPSMFGNSDQTSSSDDVFGMTRTKNQAKKQENFVRVYMKEGRILLSSGAQTQERYLFLFSDLLLVAKEKGDNSYRLKDRVRLNEVWICRDKVEEISECVKNPLNSFVVGWPTKNFVAEFCSVEERNTWYNLMESQISDEKQRENPKRSTVCVSYKCGKTLLSRKIAINNVQTSSDVLNMALNEFDPPLDERRSLQLWVQCGGKESQQYALYGHECVFAILLSYVRDLLPPTDEPDVDFSLVEDLASSNVNFKCTFFLKPRRIPKKQKSKKAGQFVSQFKKRVMIKQDSQDSFNLSSLSLGGGKLFGQPLSSVTENDVPPKPILSLMENILKDGIFMEGIFRKPPNHKVFRELRDKLDTGVVVNLDGIQPSVSASLLKEFLRFLPDSILVSNHFSQWISLCDESDAELKMQKAQNIISQLPSANVQLLRYLLCLLYHVKSKSAINQMNSYNLSICIGPSLINNAASMYSSSISNDNMNTKRVVEIVQFLIENVVELFGIETLQILGDLPENPLGKHDSGEESDSFSHLRQETSSLDSLAASGSSPSTSRPQSGLRYPTSMNVSRDSGLSEVHVSADDAATDSNGGGGGTSTPLRSVSQNEEPEDYGFIIPCDLVKSVDNVSVVERKSSPKSRSHALSMREIRQVNPFEPVYNPNWTPNRFDSSKNCSKTESSDSLYESLESTCSCDSTPTRHPRQMSNASATLIRSESGDHLISIVEMNPAPNGMGVDRRHAFRQKVSLALSVPPDAIPSSTDNSSPVSPSSSGFDSPRSRRGTPSPVSIMNRYSAVRKPARHRKGPAPMPPQIDTLDNGTSIVSLAVNDFDDDNQSDIDMGEIYEAQPIIIRCNSESSDSISSMDDDHVERKTSHKTEIYSLKSTAMPTMMSQSSKNSPFEMNKTSPTRKLSFESNEILTSLNEIKEQVSCAHLLQRALLSSRLAPSEIMNDSSTVTEASSEESTPHVSRESSRAQEYKQIADDMFKPTTPFHSYQQPISKLVEAPPTPIRTPFQRSISSILHNSTKSNEPEPLTYRAKLVSVNGSESPKYRPQSYSEAISPRSDPLPSSPTIVEPAAAKINSKRNYSVVDYNLPDQDPSPRRVSVGPCTSDGALAAAPTAPDHKLTIAVSSTVDRSKQRRLRRKTLGAEEYATLNDIYSQNMRLDRCYSAKAVPSGNNFSSMHDDVEGRNQEISWSVKQFVNFFDKGAKTQRLPVETSQSKLPWARGNVYDRLDLETRPTSTPGRTVSLHYNNHNISNVHNFPNDHSHQNGCASAKASSQHHPTTTTVPAQHYSTSASVNVSPQHHPTSVVTVHSTSTKNILIGAAGLGHTVTVRNGNGSSYDDYDSKRRSYEQPQRSNGGGRKSGEVSYV